MNKQEVKRIQIINVVVNHLSSSSDESGEWSSNCNVDFLLSESYTFSIFDKEHTIDRLKMTSRWDNIELVYANPTNSFDCIPITKSLVHRVFDRVRLEQEEGVLKGWCFADDILEMLTGERETSTIY